jgi:uncharacterized membrane protein
MHATSNLLPLLTLLAGVLRKSANYAGLFTVASYTVCPCLLQIFSSRIVRKAGLTSKTQYSNMFSNETSAWTVAFFGSAMILYAIIGSIVINV